jgi:hypothetical protein
MSFLGARVISTTSVVSRREWISLTLEKHVLELEPILFVTSEGGDHAS